MIKKIILILTLFVFLSFTFTNNFRELVLEKLENYVSNHPEKLYIQTDKPYYALGDDIWYTTYLVNGITHKRSNYSRVIYVELINEQDSIVSKKQLYTNDISVAGDFKIEKNWKPGNYLLRAFTNYMRNGDSDYFFQAQIPILGLENKDLINTNTEINQSDTGKSISITPPEINFYPEGGYLVNGISSKIGIKAKDENNRNIAIKGLIKDSNNEIISEFKTQLFGLGLILLLPEPNKTYYASININGKEFKYPFPKALSSGYNLSIINNGDNIKFKVVSNKPTGLKNSFLVGHQRGKLIFEKFETSQKNTYYFKLNTNNLLEGITNFTLFDNNGKPVCERLVFIENTNNKIKVNVSLDNKILKTRDKVSMQIDLKDKEDNSLYGNLSMSITDIDAVEQSTKNENIKAYLLLNSDIRGHIENPGYFFEKENDAKRRYFLDLVMLTHGWRRFTWNELLFKPETKKPYEPEKGLFISGYTKDLKGKNPIQSTTRLTVMEPQIYQEKKTTDYKGAFQFGPYVFFDTIPTLIEARLKDFEREFTKNRDVNISIQKNNTSSPEVIRKNIKKSDNTFSTKIEDYINKAQKISDINNEFLENARRLDEVLIIAKKKSEAEERTEILDERANNVYPTHRLDLNDVIGGESQSIIFLLNTIPGVRANSQGASIRNGGPAGIRLDGFPSTFEDIAFLFGSDIEFIDVLSGANAGFYSNASGGIISIYTKRFNPNTINVKRKPGIINFDAVGFYTAREFYAPDYGNSFDEVKKQDVRITLHWEPKIVLNEASNKAEISFFTSDASSNYAIKIEGITDNGIPFYNMSTFVVE
ncbi:Plug domain-containing protein [Algibacter aquimarinus]|uniref:TonB-dependent receptor plug domain-containing protein n=1 Tax=Algibacter aquimarinus TaxID=1136748 RepID=A0ABP9H5C2_9FLAO